MCLKGMAADATAYRARARRGGFFVGLVGQKSFWRGLGQWISSRKKAQWKKVEVSL